MLFVSVFYAQNKQVELAPFFQDGMVLQQNEPIVVWGTSISKDEIEVVFDGDRKKVSPDSDGNWKVVFDAERASFDVKEIKVNDVVVVKDVLIGELWLLAGQSNLVMRVEECGSDYPKVSEKASKYIRFFNFKYITNIGKSAYSKEDLARSNEKDYFISTWDRVSDKNIGKQSAFGWYFGEQIFNQINVPVGIIASAVGGAAINNWIPRESMEVNPLTKSYYESDWLTQNNVIKAHRSRAKKALSTGMTFDKPYIIGKTPYRFMCEPDFLFSASMWKIKYANLRGVVWYQGEADATSNSNMERYKKLLPMLVDGWRNYFEDDDLPFLIMQLPRFKKKQWATMRLIQAEAAKSIKNTYIATNIDTGELKDIHPKDKHLAGRKGAYKALEVVYEKPLKHFIEVDSYEKKKNKIVIRFKGLVKGLEYKQEVNSGFVAGVNDKKLSPCDVSVNGDELIVSIPTGAKTLKYLYEAFPIPTVFNSDGIPLAPFSIDL